MSMALRGSLTPGGSGDHLMLAARGTSPETFFQTKCMLSSANQTLAPPPLTVSSPVWALKVEVPGPGLEGVPMSSLSVKGLVAVAWAAQPDIMESRTRIAEKIRTWDM